MSQSYQDPYQPPTLISGPGGGEGDSETFKNIAFWQKFFSILLYVATGLTMMVLLFQVILAGASGSPGAMVGGIIGSIFAGAIMLLLYLIPAMRLGAAAQATREFGEGRLSVNEYAKYQKGFWRYTGMMVSIVLVAYLVILLMVVAVGFAAGGRF